MAAKNPRLNVVLSPDTLSIIEQIAKKEGKSLSVVAKELMEDAIEKHEDLLLSEMAMKREGKTQKTVSHDKAWK
jgi:predicted DNA-binding protein